jgi:cytochrome c oxidase subunit IV
MANHSAHATTTNTGHAAAGGHGGHGHHDVSKEVRKYLLVFGALMVGTVLTVWASYFDFGGHWNIVVALIIATAKASLVAAFFMHLIDERKLIYGVLGATVFFFVGLMYVTLWSMDPGSFIHLKR